MDFFEWWRLIMAFCTGIVLAILFSFGKNIIKIYNNYKIRNCELKLLFKIRVNGENFNIYNTQYRLMTGKNKFKDELKYWIEMKVKRKWVIIDITEGNDLEKVKNVYDAIMNVVNECNGEINKYKNKKILEGE
jgi:ribosome-associated translation inhibitor RaiA